MTMLFGSLQQVSKSTRTSLKSLADLMLDSKLKVFLVVFSLVSRDRVELDFSTGKLGDWSEGSRLIPRR
jgi:hypothetical protein